MKFDEESMNEILSTLLCPGEISLYPIYAVMPKTEYDLTFDTSNLVYVTYTNQDRIIIVKLESLTLNAKIHESLILSEAAKTAVEMKPFGIYSAFFRYNTELGTIRFTLNASPRTYRGAFPHQPENVKNLYTHIAGGFIRYSEDDYSDGPFTIPT